MSTPKTCALCGDNEHNIRHCNDPIVSYLLVKVRCKKWRSDKANDPCILFNWLHKRIAPELRAILIHKYCVTPKTNAKGKLVAIIMELTFNEVDPFWRVHLPADYENRPATDIHNDQEHQLLLVNIESYIQITDDYYTKSCDELVDILLNIMEENRRPVSAIIRKQITYHEKCIEVEDTQFECNICYEEMSVTNAVRLNCNHDFCKGCALTHVEKTKSYLVPCPMCRTHITSIQPFQPQPLKKVDPNLDPNLVNLLNL
jgi:hypothetical protein